MAAWNTKHRSRWEEHPRSLTRADTTLSQASSSVLAPTSPPQLSPLRTVILKCLTWHPDDRPSATDVKNYFEGVGSPTTNSAPAFPIVAFDRALTPAPTRQMDVDAETDLETVDSSPTVLTTPTSAPAKRRRIRRKTPEVPRGDSVPGLLCKCKSHNCRSGIHHRGKPCLRPTTIGQQFCEDCKCKMCPNMRRGGSGLCRACAPDELPWGMQLVRTFGQQSLLKDMTPADVEALFQLRRELAEASSGEGSHPVIEFIAAWAKDPTFIQQLSTNAPRKGCSAADLQRHLHKALRACAGQHKGEAGKCLAGGRHTGVAFCLRWLGVAAKVGGGQEFKGGVPFQPYSPPRFINNLGGTGYQMELGRSLEGLQALIAASPLLDHWTPGQEPIPWHEVKIRFEAAVKKLTEKYTLGMGGTYLAPHLLRKFLLLNGDLPPMTVQEMKDLVPDEQQILRNLPLVLLERGRLARALRCPDIYITCYNC